MAIPPPPLAQGTKIRLSVELEVVRDDGEVVEVLVPTGNGVSEVRLIRRAAIEGGEVLGG